MKKCISVVGTLLISLATISVTGCATGGAHSTYRGNPNENVALWTRAEIKATPSVTRRAEMMAENNAYSASNGVSASNEAKWKANPSDVLQAKEAAKLRAGYNKLFIRNIDRALKESIKRW